AGRAPRGRNGAARPAEVTVSAGPASSLLGPGRGAPYPLQRGCLGARRLLRGAVTVLGGRCLAVLLRRLLRGCLVCPGGQAVLRTGGGLPGRGFREGRRGHCGSRRGGRGFGGGSRGFRGRSRGFRLAGGGFCGGSRGFRGGGRGFGGGRRGVRGRGPP